MKNNASKLLIGIALMFTAGAAYSEPIEHTFSTTSQLPETDPLLTGLTSVSGSFTYDNGVLPDPVPVPAGSPVAGSTVYVALSNLSGSANGNSFSDPLGFVTVGDEKFSLFSPPTDVVVLSWDPSGENLSGFTFAGMSLVNVLFFWIEELDGIGDFLEGDPLGEALPSVLPPIISGRLRLDFVDADGVVHFARFTVTVVPVIPADSDISFSGPLAVVNFDLGGAVYSGVPIGTNIFGAINRITLDGFVSDGTTLTSLSCCDITPPRGVDVRNDFVLDAENAARLTALGGPSFVAGEIVDLIVIEGDSIAGGGQVFFGLVYVLDPLAFDNESRDNYPPDPNDILIQFFFLDEEGDPGPDIYAASGFFTTDGDGDGIQDLIDGTFDGIFNDQSTVDSNAFTDQHRGGFTFGSIIDRSDNLVTVADDPSLGVIVTAVGGAGTTQVQACNIGSGGARPATINLTDGDQIIVTCGSFTGETLAGPVTVSIGMNVDVSIPAGAIALIEELPGAVLSITNVGEEGAPDIEINDNGNITTLGFEEPPLMTILTVVVNGCDSGVANDVLPGGASIAELVTDAFNSGGEDAVEDLVEDLEDDVFLSEREAEAIEDCAEDEDDDSDSDSDSDLDSDSD